MFVGGFEASKNSVSMIYVASSGWYIIEFWQSQLATERWAEKKESFSSKKKGKWKYFTSRKPKMTNNIFTSKSFLTWHCAHRHAFGVSGYPKHVNCAHLQPHLPSSRRWRANTACKQRAAQRSWWILSQNSLRSRNPTDKQNCNL